MGHSANTFRERAAACEALKRHISDESAIEDLDRLIAEDLASARDLEAFGAPQHPVFVGGFVCTRPNAAVSIVSVVDPPVS
ncbi:MAG: hypothetical protein Q8L13_03860 [Bradyrhizobium sp.]|uniref:hypothetical protein n=1 Tax=Bradyrhizobium sp. TaxID=376 RepID=UPI0027320E98|nr:hypothetical protein [Bradyrhizobium sp.]MDP1865467.1 hypothetical protein [Bradyrhizobium sp.]